MTFRRAKFGKTSMQLSASGPIFCLGTLSRHPRLDLPISVVDQILFLLVMATWPPNNNRYARIPYKCRIGVSLLSGYYLYPTSQSSKRTLFVFDYITSGRDEYDSLYDSPELKASCRCGEPSSSADCLYSLDLTCGLSKAKKVTPLHC